MSRYTRSNKVYMLMYTLLYGRFQWLERQLDGSIIIPVNLLAKKFKTTPARLKEMLEFLYRIEGICQLNWRSHWVVVKPSVPTGMERHINEHIDAEASSAAFHKIVGEVEFKEVPDEGRE